MILEACVESLAEAIKAEELGANRIELCDNLAAGGTTPSLGTIITTKKQLKIPVIVMICPRGGNFTYSRLEMNAMIIDIRACRDAGADGIATGVLTSTGEVDMEMLQMLKQEAGDMKITFHKAIDECHDIRKEILRLKDSGIHRVLSSGGAATALNGAHLLNDMIRLADGKLTIIAAGKITSSNLMELRELIHTDEFHGRKIAGQLI
jgi:copper homeostasis protein